MIIVEGPDGAGKTTLVRQLSDWLDIPLGPRSVSSDGVGQVDLREYVLRELRFSRQIYDRFALISGPIYGVASGMKPPNNVFMDSVWHGVAEKKMVKVQPLIIYCLPKPFVVKQNIKHDPTSAKVVGNNIDQIYWGYYTRAARDRAVLPTVWYDYTTDDHLMPTRAVHDYLRENG